LSGLKGPNGIIGGGSFVQQRGQPVVGAPPPPPPLTLLFHAIFLTPLESPSMDSVTPSDDASLILINKFDTRYTQFWYLYPVN
jgi:hypothetical protein